MRKNRNADIEFNFQKIKEYMPPNFIKLIGEHINHIVSERQIQYVLYENYTDNHGIKEIALELALKEKKRQEMISRKLARLK